MSSKNRLARLARVEDALHVRRLPEPELPPEIRAAIPYLVDILTNEQSDDHITLMGGQALGRDDQRRLDTYLELLLEIAITPALEPYHPSEDCPMRPTAEVQAERLERVKAMSAALRHKPKFSFLK